MPVSLQQFFNSANTVGDSASLFPAKTVVNPLAIRLRCTASTSFPRSAKAEENRATVTAFFERP